MTRGAEAIAALTAGSARIAFDLRVAFQAGIDTWVFAREWLPIAWHEEWRGFIRHGRLVAASQYDFHHPLPPWADIEAVRQAICRMAGKLAKALRSSTLQNVTFDLWLPTQDSNLPRLIELNPWGRPTGPCLFDWDDLDDTLRWHGETRTESMSLVAEHALRGRGTRLDSGTCPPI